MMYISAVSPKYSIAEARSSLPRIVDEAEAGLEVELTRRGQPVAVVVSRRRFERLGATRQPFREAYRHFLQRFSLETIGLEGDLVGPRAKSAGRKVSL